jgi:hypothetical protein
MEVIVSSNAHEHGYFLLIFILQIYFSSLVIPTRDIEYRIWRPKETTASVHGSILVLFIRINSTSTACRDVSLNYKGKLEAVPWMSRRNTTTMVLVQRRHFALIHIAIALITRRRGLLYHCL